MAIHFGENLDKSIAYANGAIPTFGGWFLLILLSAIMTGGAIAMIVALLAIGIAGFALIGSTVVTSVPTVPEGTTMPVETVVVTETMAASGIDPAAIALLVGGGLIFMIVSLIVMLLAGFFLYGFTLRVYRGDELNFKNAGQMFWQGIVYFVIMFIYLLPAMIISEVVMFGPVTNMAYLIIVCMILPILLTFISSILAINAVIRYAKEGRFGAAFQIGKLCSIISNIGWLRYLGNIILLSIVIFVVELVLMMIPFAGWILLIVATPFIMIFQAKFLANLYESGEELEEYEDIAKAMEE